MSGLDQLLDRDGLAPGLRLLVLTTTSTARADWDALGAVVREARRRGMPRVELEETLLQGVLFFGFPRSVSAFEILVQEWPVDDPPAGGGLPRHEWHDAGTRLFDSIYDKNAAAVHAMLRGFHGEFHDFVLESAYGRVLSRPGLDARRREILAVASLAVLDQAPQLVAHARGARRFGADDAELRETLLTALGDVPEVAQHMRRLR